MGNKSARFRREFVSDYVWYTASVLFAVVGTAFYGEVRNAAPHWADKFEIILALFAIALIAASTWGGIRGPWPLVSAVVFMGLVHVLGRREENLSEFPLGVLWISSILAIIFAMVSGIMKCERDGELSQSVLGAIFLAHLSIFFPIAFWFIREPIVCWSMVLHIGAVPASGLLALLWVIIVESRNPIAPTATEPPLCAETS